MKKTELFDCEASFGIGGYKRETTPVTKEEMLSKFDRYGIDSALMRYEYASTGNARMGNLELCEVIKNDARLFPVWYAIPHHTGEFPAPAELARLMTENGVKMISLPAGNWTVAEWSCGELFNMLSEHKIPLLLPLSRVGDFNAVHNILKAHKELRVILTGVGYTVMRDVYPLLSMFPNLYISTSLYRGFEGIEDTVERFGATRLVFGSGMPNVSGASSVALLTYARISDEDKALIGSGNIKRMLSEVTF